MNGTIPNLMLMLSFPLICLGFTALGDAGLLIARRRSPSAFQGGAGRLYWAVMIAALIRSAVFSLMFLPPLYLEGAVLDAYHASQFESSVLMVLPALFGAYFATRLERHVFAMLESALLRDRVQFLAAPRSRHPKVGA